MLAKSALRYQARQQSGNQIQIEEKIIIFALPILTLADEMPSSGEDFHQVSNKTDIQWFKNEMRISPKFIEEQEGILGMSWLHFLLMLFLVIFFFMALIAYYRQTNRTKRILQHLLSEED